jgi:hypothetical protein
MNRHSANVHKAMLRTARMRTAFARAMAMGTSLSRWASDTGTTGVVLVLQRGHRLPRQRKMR